MRTTTKPPAPAPVVLPDDEPTITDEELTALALAANPDQPLDADAQPLVLFPSETPGAAGALPDWYMPRVVMRKARGWRTWVIVAIVLTFLLVDALGLCIVYGQLLAA